MNLDRFFLIFYTDFERKEEPQEESVYSVSKHTLPGVFNKAD